MTWFGVEFTFAVTLWGWRIESTNSVTKERSA